MPRCRGSFKRKSSNTTLNNLSKKQKQHLQDFGEIHPADEAVQENIRYRKVYEKDECPASSEEESSTSDTEEAPSAYDQLVSTISRKTLAINETESESEEDDGSDDGSHVDDALAATSGIADEGDAEGDSDARSHGSPAQVEDAGAETGSESEGESSEDLVDDEPLDLATAEGDMAASLTEEVTVLKENDPFSVHFEQDLDEKVAEALLQDPQWERRDVKIPLIGKSTHVCSKLIETKMPDFKEKDLRRLCVKHKLCNQVGECCRKQLKLEVSPNSGLTAFQQSLFTLLNSYMDVFYPEETCGNGCEIQLVYCLHALNHVLKTRSRVIAHNDKKRLRGDADVSDYRDQGLTRPKVLMVVPFRDSAKRIVDIIISLLRSDDTSLVSHKKRFYAEYGEETEEKRGKKPEDFEALFTGNCDDHFRFGLGIAKKTLKLYTDFYKSDIIIASPLGLRTLIGAEGEKHRDYDFLSSIEVLVFDQTDVFHMQNWDHVLHLLQHLHKQPQEAHGTDFSRVRMWTLNGWSSLYRQTLVFSNIVTPEINALVNKGCRNYSGKIVINKNHMYATISQVAVQLPQVFHRYDVTSFSAAAQARFDFFTKKILPDYRDTVKARTMIFVPSYFDYVRIRNYFRAEGIDFLPLSEYSKTKHISRTRNNFFHGRAHFLLYTERLHFYRRFRLRGARHLIVYALPTQPHFYPELCNMLQAGAHGDSLTCSVLHSRFDTQRLAGVVGLQRAARMLASKQTVHMLVSDDSA